ncbi:hypothetical protein FSP39_006463 [Pinctada imbricata]|uniref:Glutathione synthetase n=1 Tax=Pinctada imbricata TaxID=66713 RepID=A0AA89BLM2_PINIB|nr:hypothetical protein FSP39_006463 [Pinctada imbricata]
MCMRTSETPDSSDTVNPAPMTLFPSVVPRCSLEEAKSLQTKFNLLMHNVAHDHEFLEKCLQHVIKVDEFTRKLWEIYCKAKELRKNKPQICLGLFRNDFMMDVGENQSDKTPQDLARSVRLKQVEFNTIASSFGGLVTQLTHCPTCSYQLAGTKKIQQVLAGKGVLEKFIQDANDVRRMRALFAGQFSLDEDESKAISMALQNPGGYVLKPQREGGGNNLYDEELKEMLMKIKDTEERSAYILMEKIHTWVLRNHLIKVGEHSRLRDVLSEIGIYGVYIGKGTEDSIVNEESGHLMRTKALGINEGGVASGFATLDTPFLIDT